MTNGLDESPSLLGSPKVRIIGLVLIIVLLVLSAGIVLLRQRGKQAGSTTNQSGNAKSSSPSQPIVSVPDKDGDRLSDADEAKVGTDPTKPDTDADGLNDYEEVTVWKTDPLKPDTDGDGVTDGDEVKQGRNPNGPGLFKDVKAALQNKNSH